MQFSLKNRLRLISLLPIVILLSITSYFVYNSYNSYQAAQSLQTKLSTNRELNDLLNNISRERGMTIIYLGNSSANTLRSLINQRKIVDNLAKKYFEDIAKCKTCSNADKLNNAIREIQKSRLLVDEHKISFDSVYQNTYAKAQDIAIKELEKITEKQVDASLNEYSNVYINFIRANEYTALERGYIAYSIAKSKPLDADAINKWIALIAKADAFNYDTLRDTTLLSKLNKIFKDEDTVELFNDINSQRAAILVKASTGKYNTSAGMWFAMLSEKVNTISNAEDVVLSTMDAKAATIKSNAIKILAISLSIWLLSLILAVFGILLSNEIAKNILNLENVLKRVADNTHGDMQEREINLHTAKGTKEAYDLLEHIVEQAREDKESAQEASEAKSMFLANMSHEIRTPLNGIVGFTELLKDTGLQEEQEEFVDIIVKSSENLLEIINNILDLSKIETNKIEIEDIRFNPIDEFESAVEVYSVRASEKQIDLGCFIDPALEKPLKGDPTKIKEVVINLLSNAVKFTSPSGSINVDIRKQPSPQEGITRVKFEVQDSGIGVTSEQKAKIFEAFSQADTSITRKYGGTGLGLTISARFIELMGGELDLESEVGEGTTFFFTLDFEEVETTQPSLKDSYSNVNALVLQSAHKHKYQDKCLLEYLDFYGVNYTIFKNMSELESLRKEKEYDILFTDYEYCNEEELKEYASLPQKLILITKSSYLNAIEKLAITILKSIYEPLNATKLKAALESYTSKNVTAEPEELPAPVEEELTTVEEKEPEKEIAPATIDMDSIQFKANILVAEDNIINQKLIKRTLEALGFNVTLASNGLEAFQKRKDGNFDLIFMDIQMPFLDGVEATKEILEYEEEYNVPHVPIIALTANALKGDRERFLAAGLNEYTTKPLVRSEIIFLLTKFLPHKIVSNQEEAQTDTQEAEVIEEQEPPQIEIQHEEPKAEPAQEEAKIEVVEEQEEAPETETEIEEPTKQEYSADILLIKKSPFETKLFQKVLNSLEYSYEVANNLSELEKSIEENSYKVILFDKDIADLNIEEFAKLVNNKTQTTNLPTHLIMMSNEEIDDTTLPVDSVIANAVNKELLDSTIKKFIK